MANIKLTNLIEGKSEIDKFTKLHNVLVKHFKKIKNVSKVSDYGPEKDKRNPHVFNTEISVRGTEKQGYTHGVGFNLHYDTKQNKTNLFIPDKMTMYFKGVPTFKVVMNALNNELELKDF